MRKIIRLTARQIRSLLTRRRSPDSRTHATLLLSRSLDCRLSSRNKLRLLLQSSSSVIDAIKPPVFRPSQYASAISKTHTPTTAIPDLCAFCITTYASACVRSGMFCTSTRATYSRRLTLSLNSSSLYFLPFGSPCRPSVPPGARFGTLSGILTGASTCMRHRARARGGERLRPQRCRHDECAGAAADGEKYKCASHDRQSVREKSPQQTKARLSKRATAGNGRAENASLSNRWWMKAQAGARVDPASMKPAGALSPTHSTASFRSSASSVPSSASRIVGGPKPLRAPPKWAKRRRRTPLYIGPWQVRVASSILFYFIPPIRLFVAVLLTTRSLSLSLSQEFALGRALKQNNGRRRGGGGPLANTSNVSSNGGGSTSSSAAHDADLSQFVEAFKEMANNLDEDGARNMLAWSPLFLPTVEGLMRHGNDVARGPKPRMKGQNPHEARHPAPHPRAQAVAAEKLEHMNKLRAMYMAEMGEVQQQQQQYGQQQYGHDYPPNPPPPQITGGWDYGEYSEFGAPGPADDLGSPMRSNQNTYRQHSPLSATKARLVGQTAPPRSPSAPPRTGLENIRMAAEREASTASSRPPPPPPQKFAGETWDDEFDEDDVDDLLNWTSGLPEPME